MILRHEFSPADNQRLAQLCGSLDANLREVEATLGVTISRRNEAFRIDGAKKPAERALQLLQTLYEKGRRTITA